MKLNKITTFLSSLLLSISLFSENLNVQDLYKEKKDSVPASVQSVNVYEYLASNHLPTMTGEESKEAKTNSEIERYNQELRDKWFNISGTVKIPALGGVEKLRQAYLIFGAKNTDIKNNTGPQRLDQSTLIDLEILSGSKSKMQRNLISLFEPYLHTAIGKVQLQKMLCQPLQNPDELQKRQNKIKELLADAPKLEQLNTALQGLTTNENEFLWFWKNLSKSTFDQLEKDAVPTVFPLPTVAMKQIEKIPSLTEGVSKGTLLFKLLLNPIVWTLVGTGFVLYKIGLEDLKELLCKENMEMVKLGLKDIWDNNSGVISFYGTYFSAITALITYQNIKDIAIYNEANNAILTKMNCVARFIDIAREVLGPDTFSREVIGSDEFSSESKEIASLINLLNTKTFKTRPSSLSYKGRAITAFTVINKLKNQFIPMLEKLGQLDAHVAIASFMQAQQNNYCFPSYVQKNKPYISINQYWHPFLNSNTVIKNDIELGGDGVKNIIVTGPNAGGKSTALKSITLAIILAQTLGITPASNMTLTPFKIINTYMNIADDAGSESLFQAEMHRAANLLELVKKQTNKDFIFIIMDELFTGTNPLEGQSAAYGVVRKLINFNNSMLVFVTHFQNLTKLEKETNGMIKNFKVWVDQSNGHISYPYLLAPGISNQTIALDLLTEEGFDPDILKHSYEMLNYLKKTSDKN